MRSETTTITSPQDGLPLFVRIWLPDAQAKGVVQMAHGMAEHSGRYERFAQALTDAGYAVWMHDHRGHGETSSGAEDRGYYADDNGWDTVVEDLHAISDAIAERHPDLPVFFFGHSMGSLLGRDYITRYGHTLAGAVLSGTAGDPGLLGKVGQVVATLQARIRGRRTTSRLMDALTFGAYNKPFKDEGDFAWLSRDPAEVRKYVDDPRCGEVFTAGFFADLLGGVGRLQGLAARVPHDLPLLVVSGSDDPVGGKDGRGARAVAEAFSAGGVRDVTVEIFPGARHELLNEINRDEVTADVIGWLDAHLPVTKGV
ncbi:alpha/beta hydrolase [Janibacter terrae]|uniref:alpha/beta hydrolase n=1 Tax=Janibacter terrae TaxID=103817 RepID=UPI000838927C|nr:alpha/beta hydrolase [Janibacter terrae]